MISDVLQTAFNTKCNGETIPLHPAGGQNIAEAQEYRNYVVGKMCFEISEIIRVLQYTTYEEEGGDDPLNDMKKAVSLFDSNMGPAMKWVSTPTESAGGLGEDLRGWGGSVD